MSEPSREPVIDKETRDSPHAASDAELAKLVSRPPQGAAALGELYARHGLDLLAMLTARFGGHAEDAAQGAWLKAQVLLRDGNYEMTNFRGWLWTIARNLALDELRRRRAVGLDTAEEPGDGRGTTLDELAHREREHAMRDCLHALRADKPDQAAVVQAFLDGETVVDAAQRLGISRDNFDKRKQRALHSLQVCVEGKL